MCSLRTIVNGTITATAASAVTPTYYFSLNQTQIGSGFFDLYKIDAIRFSVVPQQNAVGLVAGLGLVDLYCVIDYDDATTLSNANTYNNVIKLGPGESLQRTFKPKAAQALYTGSFNGFAQMGNNWIDAASTTVQHYGIKILVPSTGVVGQTTFQVWDVTSEYFISFKNSV